MPKSLPAGVAVLADTWGVGGAMEGSSAWVLESDWCNLVGQALCEPAVCPSCPDPVQVLHPQELALLHDVQEIGPCFAPSSTVRIEGCRAAVPVVGATADARVQDLTPGPAFGVLGGLAPNPHAGKVLEGARTSPLARP